MKYFKLLLITITLISTFSCSSDDDNQDHIGIWKFTVGSVKSSSVNDNKVAPISTEITNSDCFINQIIINPNNTATIITSSRLDVTLQKLPETTNEFEQQINCVTQQESSKTYPWIKEVTYFGGYEEITLFDENLNTYLTFILYPNGVLNALPRDGNIAHKIIEIDGESVIVEEKISLNYEKQ
ncbi:hypothetical protein [Aquimarina sp. MMG016]|uniref:hypothetical protein n=1 Tax=Aquimarina sp. MMG016 TaxID=2822690 RepID=UPI001B3A3381|nr:hypothetical protein [Aquimarina sp. MMG016]MBQ4822609.1 hypothetical protein [Aquimarina sp. MMG016]